MSQVVGRYAPSPTGDLHLGNLRTALLAWLHTRLQGGEFLLRMEDLDTPRVVTGSDTQILLDLEWLGIDWDGPVCYQSQRQDLYRDALMSLEQQNLIFPCFCSRKELREIASAPHSETTKHHSKLYPGSCASLSALEIASKSKLKNPSMRLRVTDSEIRFTDGVLGLFSQTLSSEVGDFVVRRADNLFAYQLAVVVDDIEQNVSHIVRGADLLDSTPRQLYLSKCLQHNKAAFNYWHLPLVLDQDGRRMAKRDGSESAKYWRERGLSAENLVTKFAQDLNLIDQQEELSAATLLAEISIESLQTALVKASKPNRL